MVNMTLSIPADLHKAMRKHSQIKWSEVARKAFEREVRALDMMDEMLSKSELTEDDAERIGQKIKENIRKRFA